MKAIDQVNSMLQTTAVAEQQQPQRRVYTFQPGVRVYEASGCGTGAGGFQAGNSCGKGNKGGGKGGGARKKGAPFFEGRELSLFNTDDPNVFAFSSKPGAPTLSFDEMVEDVHGARDANFKSPVPEKDLQGLDTDEGKQRFIRRYSDDIMTGVIARLA